MRVTSKISFSAVTAVLLRKLVLPLPRQGVLRSLSACSHMVPIIGAAEAQSWYRAAASAFQHYHAGGGSELPLFKSSHSLRRSEYL